MSRKAHMTHQRVKLPTKETRMKIRRKFSGNRGSPPTVSERAKSNCGTSEPTSSPGW